MLSGGRDGGRQQFIRQEIPMPDTSPVLSLPYIQPAQAQKHVTHNEALRVLDAVVQLVVIATDLDTAPAAPQTGDRYVVAAPGTGAWAGQAGNIALWQDDSWFFVTPRSGWRAEVLEPRGTVVFDADSGWTAASAVAVSEVPQLGINAAADSTNRLSLSASATLLNHEGAGHQLKLNKATAGDTASLLYQTAFSGRAEMGLAGDDGFSVKVSADGNAWSTAFLADPATGEVTLPEGAVIEGALTGSAIVGTVSATGGAVMESGQTENGTYLRLADGTQICTTAFTVPDVNTAIGALYMSSTYNWFFPQSFVSPPSLFGAGGSTSRWVGGVPATNAIGSLRVLSPVSVSGAIIANAVAIGRWF
jgi:hypothetical protein